MTRDEHMEWCKKRALEYVDKSPLEAVTSMLSDLSKHEETKVVGDKMALYGIMFATKSPQQAKQFIEGFR